MPIPNIIADFRTTLALKVAVGATTATLTSITDEDGDLLPNGTYGFTIDRKNSNKEYITCTLSGTSLSAIKTIDRGTGAGTSGFALAHRKGAEVIISDFVVIKRLQDVFETGYDAATSPTTDYMLATKKYVDDLALGGATTIDRVTVAGTAGENVAAGDLVYLKLADSRWWKCDADTVATVDNVILGIAQGSGAAGNAITSGVLIKGVDANFSGLTANSVYYASNTAGGVSLTSGTNARVVGIAIDTTKLFFDPEFNKVYKNYAVDAVGTDDYAITLQSAFGALYAGMEVTFKAGTANTGAATLAVNGLTAKTIKKDVTADLNTGDILANQVVKVVYDGTNFQMVSKSPYSPVPVINVYTSDGTWTKPTGLKYIIVEVVGGGGGGGGITQNNQCAGGGGGGGYSREVLSASVLGATEEYDVGAGGTGGAGATESNGGTGGTSNFGTVAFLQATGGSGGVATGSYDGGDGGVGSDGTLNIVGQDGGVGTSDSTDDLAFSGFGGSSHYGGGGAPRRATSNGPGIAGNIYGGGGSGGCNGTSNSDANGGAGAAGIVIVTEYF